MKIIEPMVRNLYGGMAKDLQDVVNILTMNPDTNSAVFSMIRTAFHILLPFGLMIAATFALLSILDKAILFKTHNIEQVVKMLLLFALGKVVVENSFEILGGLYQMVVNMISAVGMTPQINTSDADIDAMVAAIEGLGFWDKFFFITQWLPACIIMLLMKLGIQVMAYGRLIEIYVYTAVAPLPLATIVSEEHGQIAKKFLQGYIAVCLQGLIMLLSVMIYSGLEVQFRVPIDPDSMMDGGWGFMMSSIVLFLVMIKSGSWAKQVVGLI